jgi:hypothetical protein
MATFLLYKKLSKKPVLRSKSRMEPSASTAYEKPKSRTKTDVMAVWQEQEREQRENRQE